MLSRAKDDVDADADSGRGSETRDGNKIDLHRHRLDTSERANYTRRLDLLQAFYFVGFPGCKIKVVFACQLNRDRAILAQDCPRRKLLDLTVIHQKKLAFRGGDAVARPNEEMLRSEYKT